MLLDDREFGGNVRLQFGIGDLAALDVILDLPDVVGVDLVAPLRALSTPDASIIQLGSPTKSTIWDRGLHGEGQVLGIIDHGPLGLQHCFLLSRRSMPESCCRATRTTPVLTG